MARDEDPTLQEPEALRHGETRPVRVTGSVDLALGDGGFLSRYRPGELLGEGGVGTVRLCDDRRIGRQVALKMLRTGRDAGVRTLGRFVREARVQGQLEHPSIVPVYDLALGPDGEPYFTMKRVRGRTLAEVLEGLRRGDPTFATYTRRKLLVSFVQLCLTADFAHHHGVVHRDLKPTNVMLGDFGEIYMLDWGLARVPDDPEAATVERDPEAVILASLGGGSASGSTPTMDGELLGTPGYMAPEQARGEHSRADARADVYSLGVILFEILTLQKLHEGRNIMELIGSTTSGADARASSRAPDRDVPPELEETCVRATALDSRQRHQTARELSGDIERFLDGDRDLALRRRLAEEHAQSARAAVDRALGRTGTAADRGDAMRAAGRSLALDPTNARASDAVLRLLAAPPRELPAEAQAAVDASLHGAFRTQLRRGFFAYVTWLGFAPILLWSGVTEWSSFVLTFTAVITAGLMCLVLQARPERAKNWIPVVSVVGTVAVIAASRLLGPIVMAPTLAVLHTTFYAVQGGRWRRALTLALGVAGIVIPAVLEETGAIPSTTMVGADVIRIVPAMTHLLPGALWLVVALGVIGLIILVLYVGRYRDALREVEQKLHLHAWHLSHLVPGSERSAC